mgnify:CR=1 FL=1
MLVKNIKPCLLEVLIVTNIANYGGFRGESQMGG